jgi:HU domain fused to wHTH, Ig, or Glycine-rich motif
MASRITAIRKYRPEIKRLNTMQTPELVEVIAQRTNLNEGEIRENVYELRDAILMAHKRGQAIKVEGLGTFTPTIRMDGRLDILFRPDPRLLDQLNNTENFYAAILNKANIGKSARDLITQWNKEHPDDPVIE